MSKLTDYQSAVLLSDPLYSRNYDLNSYGHYDSHFNYTTSMATVVRNDFGKFRIIDSYADKYYTRDVGGATWVFDSGIFQCEGIRKIETCYTSYAVWGSPRNTVPIYFFTNNIGNLTCIKLANFVDRLTSDLIWPYSIGYIRAYPLSDRLDVSFIDKDHRPLARATVDSLGVHPFSDKDYKLVKSLLIPESEKEGYLE